MKASRSKPESLVQSVAVKLQKSEHSELLELAEKKGTTVSDMIRSAIRNQKEQIELHQALDNQRLLITNFVFELTSQTEGWSKEDKKEVLNNIRQTMTEVSHEYQ